ncbi:hypothetical protein GCM10010405_44120 [Streptomyces macrosporus]|uniref:Uncharacterized protein n=1 Tax=Streptomyces macrosporus TaxID=44032 RepID=A0ABP5XGE8_9ACTN
MVEQAGLGYVVAVPKSQQVKSPAGPWHIDHLIADAPDDAWQRVSCGDGTKGPRLYDWAAAQLPAPQFFGGDQPTHRRPELAKPGPRTPPSTPALTLRPTNRPQGTGRDRHRH